jgi:transcriptional regulator with PAS, ATPase and Fis domain
MVSSPTAEMKEATPHGGRPPHFHLLWDYELDALAGILDAILKRKAEVLAHWHELYVLHFGDSRALSEREFMEIFDADLSATIGDLRASDIEKFVADVHRIGEQLAERRVPFAEIIVSTHLFEESATKVFPAFPPALAKTYLAFDKLSHCRMIVLADAYFRSTSALANARIRDLEKEAAQIPGAARSRFRGLVGANPAMRRLYERIEAAARNRGTILIVGESGTGKELVARAIHECSPASWAPLVALNCAAIPRDLIESELFGYQRGAFSGAVSEHLGLFRSANGGSIFLDEITEMSPLTQTKLLRALQERTVRPVGSSVEVPIDIQLIASTNREPAEAVRSGQLRSDLYYRLQANVIHLPPLRERRDDIPLLVEHFLGLFNEKIKRRAPIGAVTEEALAALMRYDWPGNVRELSNAIEGAFTFSPNPVIDAADLPDEILGRGPAHGCLAAAGTARAAQANDAIPTFAEAERDLVRRALESAQGNKVQAAKLLRISRKKLYATIVKYGLG